MVLVWFRQYIQVPLTDRIDPDQEQTFISMGLANSLLIGSTNGYTDLPLDPDTTKYSSTSSHGLPLHEKYHKSRHRFLELHASVRVYPASLSYNRNRRSIRMDPMDNQMCQTQGEN